MYEAGSASFYHYDGLGSTTALTDAFGIVTDSYVYDGWGEREVISGNTANPYRFAGERWDDALGQYYLRARMYDQAIGRFTQMDQFQGFLFNPSTQHKYLYATADPINQVDPSGYMTLTELSASLREIGEGKIKELGGYRVIFRKATCLVLETLAEEALEHVIYIFLDSVTGLPYVGKTKNKLATRLAEHTREGKRVIEKVLGVFKVVGGKEELQITEELIILLITDQNPVLEKVSNDIHALSPTKPSKKLSRLKEILHFCK